ncbi:hydroxymethylbilane synthase [Streptomyces griseocarneus]|uniref:hydroxymethylbilane synthase n=1 Tax=Streptomyces griseocarneus TaxID=51201 RepID=UPI00167E0DFD|nr:hydroxymethylbilane synthase [Streptomyces griseocarneus]MBZ6475424.1 hydroxymethylbilane synthase [Streptomyces griseocarneus]GHG75167.1 porphobilinogen deaminase 2 [Streptomyces griseocarneus]
MKTTCVVRVGSRNSTMARRQTDWCVELLSKAHPGIRFEISTMASQGDRYQGPLSRIGGKGAFVKALDRALLDGEMDVTVSCVKDLPSPHDRQPGVSIGAVLERGDVRDALVVPAGRPPRALADLPRGARIGTSAPRRIAQLRQRHPRLEPVLVRGNADTRIARLDDGSSGLDALLVAYAGLHRLGRTHRATQVLDPAQWLPASGAGMVVAEYRTGDTTIRELLAPITHPATATALAAERATLATLRGNCMTAASAHATLTGTTVTVDAAVFAPDGHTCLRARATGPLQQPEEVGRRAAEQLLHHGAAALLHALPSNP